MLFRSAKKKKRKRWRLHCQKDLREGRRASAKARRERTLVVCRNDHLDQDSRWGGEGKGGRLSVEITISGEGKERPFYGEKRAGERKVAQKGKVGYLLLDSRRELLESVTDDCVSGERSTDTERDLRHKKEKNGSLT